MNFNVFAIVTSASSSDFYLWVANANEFLVIAEGLPGLVINQRGYSGARRLRTKVAGRPPTRRFQRRAGRLYVRVNWQNTEVPGSVQNRQLLLTSSYLRHGKDCPLRAKTASERPRARRARKQRGRVPSDSRRYRPRHPLPHISHRVKAPLPEGKDPGAKKSISQHN